MRHIKRGKYAKGKVEQAADVGARLRARVERDLLEKGIANLPDHGTQKGYACQICNDNKFVRAGDYDIHHPMFGMLVPCQCNTGGDTKELADEYTNLFPRDLKRTWDSLVEVDALQTNIHEAIYAIDQVTKVGYGWVYLWGGYGTAKTAILKTACATAMRAGRHSCYTRMQDIVDGVLAAYDQGQGAAVRMVKNWSMVDFLAVDELEKVAESREVIKRRFQIFDYRYNASTDGRNGITIMAGNVPPRELEPALASRLVDGRNYVVELTGTDARPYTKALNLDEE